MTTEQIARILAPVYVEQGWRWARMHAADGIPTEDEIETFLDLLLDDCRDLHRRERCEVKVSSGRLTVEAEYDDGRFVGYHASLDFGTLHEEARR